MLEIVYGQTKNAPIANQLIAKLKSLNVDATLYLGYPIFSSADDSVAVDALLISQSLGVIIFVFGGVVTSPRSTEDIDRLVEEQDAIYFAARTSLSRHPHLRRGRELAVDLRVVTLIPAPLPSGLTSPGSQIIPIASIQTALDNRHPIADDFWRPLNAALQRVTTIKPKKKRTNATTAGSRGSTLKEIEREIANLDQWQKQAAIESPDAPQRIRGLAGSGKTIVLALKAAYLHTQHPDWDIAVTFYSRALYQQFKDLIRRFCFEHISDEPNWDKLRIVHAWGGRDRAGLYAEMADHASVVVRDFSYGKAMFGMNKAFEGVCKELLAATAGRAAGDLYDAVLIDEAQDLPLEFFRLVHRFTKPPHRIVWAYDELQNLSDAATPSTTELFGVDNAGRPLVELRNDEGLPRQDVILPVCYRNSPWALTLAHALGIGVHRTGGLVQHFDDPTLWQEIGYEVKSGSLTLGAEVTLERARSSYPEYFARLMTPADAIVVKSFEGEIEQANWVAKQIKTNIEEDELEHDDVLIVLPTAYTARTASRHIIEALAGHGIASHLAGATTSADELFIAKSIAIAQIYRAKGNEAPMIYFMNADECFAGYELIKLRNILFTGITRSRAWVRISGTGSNMAGLVAEIDAVVQDNYQLSFTIPTTPELKQLRTIHRDRTETERSRVKKAERAGAEFVRALEDEEISFDNLPPTMRQKLTRLIQRANRKDDSKDTEN